MPFLLRPWNRKPSGGPIALDLSNSLTTGIVSCLPFLDGQGPPKEVVPNPIRTAGGAATWDIGPSGPCAYAWSFSNATTADLGFTAGGFTVAAVMKVVDASGSGNPSIVSRATYTSESVNTGWNIGFDTTPRYHLDIFNNNAVTLYRLNNTSVPVVGDHVLIGTNNGTNLASIYVDGVLEATKSVTTPLSSTAGLVDQGTGATRLYLAVIWNRALSAAEASSFSSNPWQIFVGPPRLIYAPIAVPAAPFPPWPPPSILQLGA